jgi:nucleotidyltransferase substrate binding protein (TIGR01987 family)
MNTNLRWVQRFQNFNKAFKKLAEAIEYIQLKSPDTIDAPQNPKRIQDEILVEGLIQRFEYTHELALNVMKDYCTYRGITGIGGSRDATREAFRLAIITDGKVWMDMIASRNESSHTYNQATANSIYIRIIQEYFHAFKAFHNIMEDKSNQLSNNPW